jgi:DNA-binding IclR family transcriptional regulator
VKNKPAYTIESVDHALRVAIMLQQEGDLRLADVAERLGVARSTAHRLLAMLVYHEFAEQGSDRRYGVGPVLRRQMRPEPLAELRSAALPHLQLLAEQAGETANLMVLRGDQVRFVASVECTHMLRVGDRSGRLLPAHLASGGQLLLAGLPPAEVDRRFAGRPDVDPAKLRRALAQARRRGHVVNNQRTETGVVAVGVAVAGAHGEPVAALSLAMPTVRYSPARLPELLEVLQRAARSIEAELAAGVL